MEKMNVKPATGKLGVLCVGLGAVTSTFMTGVLMARKGLAKPVGSMTQYDKMRVGRGENKKYLHYGEIVPLANLNDIVFGAWDVYPANAYESAVNAEVLKEKDINPVKDELEKIVPMKAAFDHNYASRLDGDNVKDCKNRWDMMEQLREDIRNFKVANNCDRIVVLWAASTEIYVPVDEKIHGTLAALEQAMKDDDKAHIAPSMCYAYAALSEGCPFIMGAPNTTVDIPAMKCCGLSIWNIRCRWIRKVSVRHTFLEKGRWLNILLSSLGIIFMMCFLSRLNFRWNGWRNRESCLWMSCNCNLMQ